MTADRWAHAAGAQSHRLAWAPVMQKMDLNNVRMCVVQNLTDNCQSPVSRGSDTGPEVSHHTAGRVWGRMRKVTVNPSLHPSFISSSLLLPSLAPPSIFPRPSSFPSLVTPSFSLPALLRPSSFPPSVLFPSFRLFFLSSNLHLEANVLRATAGV